MEFPNILEAVKVKSLNKELGILKSKEAVDKLLETTKQKGREGLGFDPSSSKRKGRTTFIPPKPTTTPNKQKGKEKEKPTEVPKKEAAKYPGVWYLDSGCSRHMMGDASLLSNLIPYDGPRITFGGSNDFGLTKGLGNLVYKGLTIQAVSYVEGLNYNLLSISQFCDKGYSLEFCKDMTSLKNISTNEVILTGKRIRNIYEVMWDNVKEACLISKSDTNLLWLWHKRLSHLNFKTLNKLSKEGLVEGLPKAAFRKESICDACQKGKQVKSTFKAKSAPSTTRILSLIHMDLFGPVTPISLSGKKYVLVVVDDYSRYTWTIFLNSKKETQGKLTNCMKLIQNQANKDEEVNEGDRMKPTEFIPFRSLPLKTSQRNPDSDSAEPSGNFGQPSNIPDLSNGDNSGNGDPVPIHPETPITSVLQPEAELDQPVNPNQHNLRWLRDHPPQQIIGDIQSGVRTRSAQQNLEAMLACFISQNAAEERDSLSRDISNFALDEAEGESERTLKVTDEEDVQEDAESLPMQLFQRTPSSHQVTNFHFHSSSTPTLPDIVPEIWTKKVQGLIESALASQHASFRQEIEQMEAKYTKLIEKSEEKHNTDLKEISISVDKTLEIISLLSNTVSNTMEIYASDSQLQLKEINKVKEQIASVTVSLQKQMSLLQMDIRLALAVASANQVVTKDYLKVIIDNKKEAYKLFRLIGANSGNRKMEVILQQHSPSPIPQLPIAVKEGEVSYIPSHLNMTNLILEAQQRNPENSAQHLSSSGLDGIEFIGTVVDHFSNDAQSEERCENLRRIKELCGNMQGLSEVAGSSKRKRN
ncbi:unnamed protein product [Cuscuta campestris]|uniref:Uncharacterized protein n=1 Tax=Cuscuta campestris TaxID=132261 RepID=A0A484MP46_9ASTE|nr:unnamed protein product [Cuscuta campestris]